MIDCELCLPACWVDDAERCAAAGVPDDIEFLTEPALAAGLLSRALVAGVPAWWVAGDEFYGNDPDLRAECGTHRITYVLAVGRDRRVATPAGPVRADELAASLPRRAWQRLSAGSGAKGTALLLLGVDHLVLGRRPRRPRQRYRVLVAGGAAKPQHR